MSGFQLQDGKWTGQQCASSINHHVPNKLSLESNPLDLFIVFSTFWTEDNGFLEIKVQKDAEVV